MIEIQGIKIKSLVITNSGFWSIFGASSHTFHNLSRFWEPQALCFILNKIRSYKKLK
jgi:hypothetical protein